jgi:predicted type IV restriction endonuclease
LYNKTPIERQASFYTHVNLPNTINETLPPFALIAEQVKHEFELLAFPEADELNLDNLKKQLKLVEYYLAKGLIVQGVTLAREWVVSYVA